MARRRVTCDSFPVKPHAPTCERCGMVAQPRRRGLCFRCYQRERRGHQRHGPCSVCRCADVRVLRRHQLADGWTVLCANHAAIAGRRAITLAELVVESGDRRRGDRRTHRERRQRVVVEWLAPDVDRRVGDRRG